MFHLLFNQQYEKSIVHRCCTISIASLVYAAPVQTKPAAKSKTSTAKPDKTVVQYTCSMYPEVLSSKPGKCPKCGMSLVKKEKGKTPASDKMM